MFSVRLVKADHYMSIPIPGLDVRYSEFRGIEVKQVPVIRIFGSTALGQKVCLHIHGVFPYIYIPYDGCIEKDKFIYQIASGIDKALNVALGNSNSHTQHVYKVNIVSAIPFYGFHSKSHQFLKIYFYNPLMIKKASDLLQNGVILGQVFQPHEAHIPFTLQFCMDYNLHGMSFVNLANVRYRQGAVEGSNFKVPSLDDVPQELLLSENILRVSTCQLEVDAVAADILNQQEIAGQITSNPGLKAIWDEEKERRRNENRDSQFTPQNSQTREASSTASEKYHLERLKKRLCEVALLNENIKPVMEKSLSAEKRKPYPAPTPEGVKHLEASFLVTHVDSLCHDNDSNKSIDKIVSENICTEQENVEKSETSSPLNSPIIPEPNSSQSSILNSQCLSLVQILQDLVEDDSVLGSQHQGNGEDDERASDSEDDVLSQTLDCKELDRENAPCSPLRLSPEGKYAETGSSSRRDEIFILPQLDGANDQLGEDDDKDPLPKHQVVSQQKVQQKQLLRIVPDCLSGTPDFPEIVTDYTRDNLSLHSDLPIVSEPDLADSKLNIDSFNDLDVVNETEMGTSLPIDLSDNSDCFTNESSDNYLLSLDQCDAQKLLFCSEPTDSDGVDEADKGIHPKSLLLGDPWLTARPITSEKDEFSDENFSCPQDVWSIDMESSTWIPGSEKYFSETPLITLPEGDEISSHYEPGDLAEFSVEKSSVENRISSSETKRRLCSLIKSRTKAKEVSNVNKINCELINVDDIVNCETAAVNEYENSTPFGAIFQGSDYDQFLDESYRDSGQTILSNVGECNLLNDGDLKTLESCAIVECSKNNLIDETFSRLQEDLGEETFDISSCNALKPKKKPIFSQSNRIDESTSTKQRLLDARDLEGLKDNLDNDISKNFVSKTRRLVRKSKSVKEQELTASNKTAVLEEDKIENNYRLRNRVKNIERKRRKKSKQLNESESVHNMNETAIDVLQDSLNINNRTVKERLGILVRNSIDKKYPVRESLLEEKTDSHGSLFTGPKTRQSLKSSRAVRSLSQCEKRMLPDSNFMHTSRKDEQLITKNSTVDESCISKRSEKGNKNIGVMPLSVKESTLQTSEFIDSSVCVDNNKTCMNSNDMKADDGLAKRGIGQYVRQRLGMLVESRSKLSSKSGDNVSVLDSKVPSLSGKIDNGCIKVNSNKYLTRYRKNKINDVKPVECKESSVEIANIASIDKSVKDSYDGPLGKLDEIFLDGENNNAVHIEKDIVTSGKNFEVHGTVHTVLLKDAELKEEKLMVNGLQADNRNDATSVKDLVLMKENSGKSELQEDRPTNDTLALKDTVPTEESSEENELQRDNRNIIDTPTENVVLIEENSEGNDSHDIRSMVDTCSEKDSVPIEETFEENEFHGACRSIIHSPSGRVLASVEENTEENEILRDDRSTIDSLSMKDAVSIEVNSEENELQQDNRNTIDTPPETDALLIEENSQENELQGDITSSIDTFSVKNAVSIEKGSEKNELQRDNRNTIDTPTEVGAVPVKENSEENEVQRDNTNTVDSLFVKDTVLIEENPKESKLQVVSGRTNDISSAKDSLLIEENSKVNKSLGGNGSTICTSSVEESEIDKLQTGNSSATKTTSMKGTLILSGENKLLVGNKSVFKKREGRRKNFKVANEIHTRFTEDLLNLHSIQPCYVRLLKCNLDDCKGPKTVKSCKKHISFSKRKRRKNSINRGKSKLDSTNESSKIAVEQNSGSINSGNKLPKTKKTEETDPQNALNVSLMQCNTTPGFVNSMDEQSNRLESVKLNMKCVVPNSPKLLDKTVKKSGEIGSLKAVVQAESPRVADTLDTLPENPAQMFRHYAPGGIYLHSTEGRSLHLVGDYLREGNVVEVAKIPQLASTQSAKSEQVSLSEEKDQQKPVSEASKMSVETNESVNKDESFKVAEDANEEFLSFTRRSLKRRILRSDEKCRRKRERKRENDASKASYNVETNVTESLLNNQGVNIENADKNKNETCDGKIVEVTTDKCFIENDKQCTSYENKDIKNQFQNEIQEKVVLGNFSENNSLIDVNVEGSVTCVNSIFPSTAGNDRSISDLQLRLKLPELPKTENEQILCQSNPSDQIEELQNSSKNSVSKKTLVGERRKTGLNSKSSKTKINPVKRSKRISSNNKLMPKHNNDMAEDFGENSQAGNTQEDVLTKMQLRSVSSFKCNLIDGSKDSGEIKKIPEDKVLSENKRNSKTVNNIHCKTGEISRIETSGESCSEIKKKVMMSISGENIVGETKELKRNLPCVDGTNDSSDSDSANQSVPLPIQSPRLRRREYKQVVKIENKHSRKPACSQTVDESVKHGEKLETENSLEKNSPVKSPKKQMYKPLDVVIKKSPLKSKLNAELQLIDPSCAVEVHTNQNKGANSDELRKYLSLVLKRFVTKHDLRKFQPQVMVRRLKSCIPKRQTVHLRNSRPRRRKLRDEICICVNHGQGESITGGEKCEKTKGVSLELQQREQSEKKTFLCKHLGEELAKVTCQNHSENDEENLHFVSCKNSVVARTGVLKSTSFGSKRALVKSPKANEHFFISQSSIFEDDEYACNDFSKSSNIRELDVSENKKVSLTENICNILDVPEDEMMEKPNAHECDETYEFGRGVFCSSAKNDEVKTFSQESAVESTSAKLIKTSPVANVEDLMAKELSCKCISSSVEEEVRNRTVICVPKMTPPTRKQVLQNLSLLNLPEQKFLKPFFSNALDVVERKEVGKKNLKILSCSVKELELFESMLPALKGLDAYKNEAIRDFWEQSMTSDENAESIFKDGCLKAALTGLRETILTPISCAPSVKDVKLWAKARQYYKEKKFEITKKCKNSNMGNLKPLLLNKDKHAKLIVPVTSPSGTQTSEIASTSTKFCQSKLQELDYQLFQNKESTQTHDCVNESKISNDDLLYSDRGQEIKIKQSTQSSNSNSSGITCQSKVNECPRSTLDNLLAQSQFCQQLTTPEVGQASRSHDTLGFKMSYENLQDCRTVIEPQYLTLLAIELHIQTRGDLRPDPAHDPVGAVFYCIQNDVPEESSVPNLISGIIIVQDPSSRKHNPLVRNIEVNCKVSYVSDERTLMEEMVHLVQFWDPDILAGYEVEMLSWGYLFERAYLLELNLCPLVSRIPGARQGNKSKNAIDETAMELQEEFSLLGRIVLNVWRLMRHEVSLQSYTFENVSFHVLHERIPLFSFKTLTQWWGHRTRYYWGRVADHYLLRVRGLVRILDQLDLINRTSELARIFGIQFYEVLSRGSQFRVESMMLRLAKPLNYVPVSPSVQQRARMRAPEYLQLIMEPESQFYVDPVIVLDFQSLYPSIIIAYNYCFSTCLGRVEHLGQSSPFEFGSSHLHVPPNQIKQFLGNLNISPGGVVFVNTTIRKGILPQMLEEILETRLMVKKSMKEHKENKILQRVLHSRQLGLKLIANVTYGYTAANFSGRMSCVEIADSVVSKGRETLERAIHLVENTPQWGAHVVYGDTDSLFVLVPGRSREDAFVIGAEIAEAVTRSNPSPVKLKLEKVYQPCILQTKKRYVGYMYESANQNEPAYDAKGIETVRRDGCPAVAKILEKSLRVLFETKDVSKVKAYVQRKFSQLLEGQMSIQDLTFAREYRGSGGYKPGACVPALELTKRWLSVDPRAEPRVSERVPYIIVSGAPNMTLIQLVKSPHELLAEPSLRVHSHYYVSRVLCPPLARCFSLLGADVLSWYQDLPRRSVLSLPKSLQNKEQRKFTISQYFSTSNCLVCHQICQLGICTECQHKPQTSAVVLAEMLHEWERHYYNLEKICQSCCGYFDQIECISLDCPVMFHRNQAKHTMLQESFTRTLQENL